MVLGLLALTVYVIGGIGTFAGLGMIFFMKDRSLLNWGDARSIGYLFLCVGLLLSMLGVLLMRILRNRPLK
jgi:hypothetical protein